MNDSDWNSQNDKLNALMKTKTPPTPCGCTVERNDGCGWDDKDKIEYCPLHANAERLRDALEAILKQMKLINGSDENCVIKEWKECANHNLIHEVEALLTSCREKGK